MQGNFLLQKRADAEFSQKSSMDSEPSGEQSVSMEGLKYMNSASRSAVISFLNYMPLERACHIFISHIFREELNSGQKNALLSEKINRAGIFIGSGITEQGSNAWFFSVHLGGGVFLQEMQMLNLINQVRAYPQTTAAFMKNALLSLMSPPGWTEILEASYSPLFLDSDIYKFLQSVQDLGSITEEYPDTHFFHYDFTNLSEKDPLKPWAPMVSVAKMFTELIGREFFAQPSEQLIFSRQFSLLAPKMIFSDDYLAVQGMMAGAKARIPVEEADSELPDMAHLYILAFSDTNEDGLYSPGAESSGTIF